MSSPTPPARKPAPARGVHAAATPTAVTTWQRAEARAPQTPARPSALFDPRVVYCGDNPEQLRKLPEVCA